MFRKSDELIAVMKRLMVAIQSGDSATARGLIANQPETLLVASSAEWLYGVEAYAVISAQLSASPGYERTFHTVEAYEEGSIGWAATASTVTFSSGKKVPARTTAVFHLKDGAWKVVQCPASTPAVDADDWVGVEMPRSLSDLIDSLDDGLDATLAAKFDTPEVTLLISDIEDSTQYGVNFGDALWSDIVKRHFDHLQRITSTNRGTIIKTMGDGALIAFDKAADAARTAIEIQRTSVDYKIRIGLHVGQAVHTDGDYFGYTVNKTARLASAAAGGQILISEPMARHLAESAEFAVGEPRSLTLKGLPGTHTAYPLVSWS